MAVISFPCKADLHMVSEMETHMLIAASLVRQEDSIRTRIDREPVVFGPFLDQELSARRFSMGEIYLCGVLHIAGFCYPKILWGQMKQFVW